MLFKEGTIGSNQYGDDPKETGRSNLQKEKKSKNDLNKFDEYYSKSSVSQLIYTLQNRNLDEKWYQGLLAHLPKREMTYEQRRQIKQIINPEENVTNGINHEVNSITKITNEDSKNKRNSGRDAKGEEITKYSTDHSRKDYNLDDLEKLAKFKEKGIITEEEFNIKKKQILGI